MRLPWGKFYWDDFERDCSPLSNEACGAWIRLLCIMSRSPRPGSLLHATGHPYTDEDAARALRLSLDGWLAVSAELLRTGVASHDKHGTLINRRMVREAKERSSERIRKAENYQKRANPLSHQRKFPEVFREVSGDFPGEKPEARSQKPEAAASAASPPAAIEELTESVQVAIRSIPGPDGTPRWRCDRDLARRIAEAAVSEFPAISAQEIAALIPLAQRRSQREPTLFEKTVPEEIQKYLVKDEKP